MLYSGAALTLVVVCALLTFAIGMLARAKIGGQTGDVLGATQQVVEIGALLTLSTLAPF
jgi:adenosylcobinamide-GDP ribazoletransferase